MIIIVKRPYKFKSPICSDGSHFYGQSKNIRLINTAYSRSSLSQDQRKQQCEGIRKRKGDCKICNQLRFLQDTYMDTITIETLKMFKEMKLKSTILPYTNDINDINNVEMLVKDAKNFDDVWKVMVDTYKNNKDFFSKDQSEQFIRNINRVTNEYIIYIKIYRFKIL